MTQSELNKVINELEGQVSKDKATFGIFKYGGDSDESYIQADKEGLKLFALELLKAANKSSDILIDKGKNIVPIPFQENWIDEQSDTVIQYIEPVAERPKSIEEKKYKETIVDKLVPFGCYAILIILAVALLTGLWTLIKLIF